MQRLITSVVMLASLIVGCARVDYGFVPYTPIPAADFGQLESQNPAILKAKQDNWNADAKEWGIRYYESAPYLLVFSDGKGAIKWKIYYLPDQTKKRTIEPNAFLATVNTTHTFINGTLATGSAAADSSALPKAVVSALQGVLTSAAGAALADMKNPNLVTTVPAPQLYKIVVKDGYVELHGGAGDVDVKVSLQ